MWKRGEIAPKEQFLLFSALFYIYISNFRSQSTYSFVKCGCSIYCFPHSLNLGVVGWCEGAVYLTSLGRPTDIGLQLGKACYPCSG